MTPTEQLLNTIMLAFIVLYSLSIASLSGFYVHRHKWREKSIPYLYVCIVSVVTGVFYALFLFGVVISPTLISAVIGRLCLILLLTAFLTFAIVDL